MGCTSDKHIKTKDENIPNQVIQQVNQEQNIEHKNESVKVLESKKEENNKEKQTLNKEEENEIREEILYLEYETTSDNEEIRLFGNEVDEYDDYTIPFFEREYTKFDLYYNDIKINEFYYTFEKAGIHTIKMTIKEKITDFTYMFYNCI